jgi:exo-1,4-beta-D-glucosaminidase
MAVKALRSVYLLAVPLIMTLATYANEQPARQGLREWTMQSACISQASGEQISAAGFRATDWHAVQVPATVIAALVADHTVPDPYIGTNILKLAGYSDRYDFSNAEMPEGSPYRCGWWYRTEFTTSAGSEGQIPWLHFDGINYRADIWLNGKKLADSRQVAGAFRAYEFNVEDRLLADEKNVLAVEVFAPTVNDLPITWWDWSPTPPDKDMGIWKDVYLTASGPVSLRHPLVTSKVAATLRSAELTMQVEARNDSSAPIKGVLRAQVDERKLEQPVELAAGEKKIVRFRPAQFPNLRIDHPKLWWPFQMGTPNLHTASFAFEIGSQSSDLASIRFGIREVTSELDANKNRLFKVNGQRILIKGGGWASDMLLRQWPKRLRDEFAHVRQLNLNTIRLEGKMETDAFFDLADEQGILVMAGWMCCDLWQETNRWTPETHQVASESLRTQLLRLRPHPSMLVWLYGSDEPQPPDIEREYLQVLKETEWPNPALSSASASPSTLTGVTGVKMSGPYDYVPPLYWYHPHAQSLTFGGAFSFNTETSPGFAVPTLQSMEKMVGPDHLWPIDAAWTTHAGGNEFAHMDIYNHAMEATYGPSADLKDYLRKSQAIAYNGERAMFEAYGRNKYTSTGIIQWMLNNAWPSTLWHLYDYYLQAGGGYFGTRKANEALHVQYSYDDRSVVVVNNRDQAVGGLRVLADLYDADLKKISSQRKAIEANADSSQRVLHVPAAKSPISYLKLELRDRAGRIVSTNFYWLSADSPTFDWGKTTFVNTPSPHYEDLTALNHLPEVSLKSSVSSTSSGGRRLLHVSVENPSKSLAFQIALRAYAKADGSDITPVLWDDNYFSLLPGESRSVTAGIAAEDLHGQEPAVEVGGWNVKASTAEFMSTAKKPTGPKNSYQFKEKERADAAAR